MSKSKGSSAKAKLAAELNEKIKKYKSILLVDINGFPSPNFEKIRRILRGRADFVYTNKVVIYNALKGINNDLAEKAETLRMPVLLLSNEDPFGLAHVAVENKSFAKIKEGEESPEDITLPSGPTPFPPGPMLSQFSSIGVKTKNEAGKISIVSDTTILKKGETASAKIANILSSMDIRPKPVVLSIAYAFSEGLVVAGALLYKSVADYIDEVKTAFTRTLSLSVGRGILNRYSVKSIIKKVYIGVRFLSVNRNIVTDETIGDILAKATAQANALKNTGGMH